MFIIPFIKKPDWRKPPIVTVRLILINVFVFVAFQLNDDKQRERAVAFYLDSGLPAIELPRYVQQLCKTGKEKHVQHQLALAGVHSLPMRFSVREVMLPREGLFRLRHGWRGWKPNRN